MVKVFTTGAGANEAGNDLTAQFERWGKSFDEKTQVVIKTTHSNSNRYGWMLVVEYTTKNGYNGLRNNI